VISRSVAMFGASRVYVLESSWAGLPPLSVREVDPVFHVPLVRDLVGGAKAEDVAF